MANKRTQNGVKAPSHRLRTLLAALSVSVLAVSFGAQAAQATQALFGDIHEVVIEVSPAGDVVADEGETIRFDASATHLEGNVPADYFWFSWRIDGREIEGRELEDPILDFKGDPGNHTVTLAVWGHPENIEDGPPTADEITINVRFGSSTAPKADISPAGPLEVAVGYTVPLSGEGSARINGGRCTWSVDGVPDRFSNCWSFTFYTREPGPHVVTLKVEDRRGASDTATLHLNAHIAGFPTTKFTPDANQTIQVPRSITFDGSASSAVGGRPLTYAWYVSGANAISGVASTAKTFTPKFTRAGSSVVRLVVTDGDGLSRGKSVRINTFTSRCAAPAADARVTAGSSLTFDAACWTNNPNLDFASVKYEWRTTGKSGVVSTGSSYGRTFDKAGRFGVELTAVDRFGQRSKVHRNVWVKADAKPVASFTPARDATVRVGTRVAFNGSRSSDPDGGVLTYRWYTTGIRGTVSKTNSYARTFTRAGKYRVRLEVLDDERNRVTKTVEITVR